MKLADDEAYGKSLTETRNIVDDIENLDRFSPFPESRLS